MTPPIPTDHTLARTPGPAWYHSAADLQDVTGKERVGESERVDRIDLSRWIPLATGALLVIGILLRLRMFLFNRSLWFDEALLTVNILDRPFSELLPPLEHH